MGSFLTLLGAGNSGSFDPSTIAGLEFWVKADAITGLNDGDAVSTWPDSSGNSRDLSSSLTLRPLYKTGILNSKPVVRFDGVDDTMSNASYTPNANTQTIFIAYTGRSGANGSFYSTNSSNGPLQRSTSTFFSGVAAAITTTSLNSAKLFTALYNYTTDNYTVRLNGVDQTPSTALASLAGTTLNIGSRQATEYYTGDIAEILIYNTVLNATNYGNVEEYLRLKWSLF